MCNIVTLVWDCQFVTNEKQRSGQESCLKTDIICTVCSVSGVKMTHLSFNFTKSPQSIVLLIKIC